MHRKHAIGPMTLLVLCVPAVAPGAQAQSNLSGSEARVELILDEMVSKLITASDAHWHKGEYNHNIHLSRALISARPDLVEIYANAGWLLWSMNRDAEAVALYEKGIKANPNTYYMYDELGQYYITRKKDYASAMKHYEQAVKHKDAKPQSWNALALCYERTGQLEKALKTWERAALMKNNPAGAHNLRRVRAKLGRPANP